LIELILKDIEDPYVRENFFRLSRFINAQPIFDGEFKLFDVSVSPGQRNSPIQHGLTFIPYDIILLSIEGDANFSFRYQNFDKTNIYITNEDQVRIRFLAGRFKDLAGRPNRTPFKEVRPDYVRGLPFPPFTRFCSGSLSLLDPDCYNTVDCNELPIDWTLQNLDMGTLDEFGN